MAHRETLIRLRAISTFELMTEDQIRRGLEAMREAAEAEAQPIPVPDPIDLLVLTRP